MGLISRVSSRTYRIQKPCLTTCLNKPKNYSPGIKEMRAPPPHQQQPFLRKQAHKKYHKKEILKKRIKTTKIENGRRITKTTSRTTMPLKNLTLKILVKPRTKTLTILTRRSDSVMTLIRCIP